ncbi:uncharacterized protein LOC134177036 [Corticium candelabrum]|uniref:uncharacterized protein LOC134177036 n=1 Tax=Corticium candelabrum TaxID=121492 RepID=UPI002E258B40|nr:uncharacterized protein LOC134177036 [Corticium candelabrum]
MSPNEFVIAVRLWLGIKMFPSPLASVLCSCDQHIDTFGDHLLGCGFGPERTPLKDHSFIDSCCITLLYVYEKEMLLILEILDEIDWRVFKLKGVHRPIEVSAASAIAPALIAALVMKKFRSQVADLKALVSSSATEQVRQAEDLQQSIQAALMRWSQTLPHTLLNQLREQLVAATVSASVSQQKFYEVATDKGRKLKLEADLYKSRIDEMLMNLEETIVNPTMIMIQQNLDKCQEQMATILTAAVKKRTKKSPSIPRDLSAKR